jgi:hypothetical protein
LLYILRIIFYQLKYAGHENLRKISLFLRSFLSTQGSDKGHQQGPKRKRRPKWKTNGASAVFIGAVPVPSFQALRLLLCVVFVVLAPDFFLQQQLVATSNSISTSPLTSKVETVVSTSSTVSRTGAAVSKLDDGNISSDVVDDDESQGTAFFHASKPFHGSVKYILDSSIMEPRATAVSNSKG